MFQASAPQAHWTGTLSNWALGTTGIYIGLVVTNFDAISRHLPAGFQMPVFWFALISAVLGIFVQVLWGFVQMQLSIEERFLAVVLPEVAKARNDPSFLSKVLNPALDEFINSRPFPFRQLAQWGKKKVAKDLVMVPKSAATAAQIMSLILIVQYVFLGAAIFWPLGVITLTPNRPEIGSLSTTPSPSQTPTPATPKPTLSPKPIPTASATPASK